MKEKPGMSYLLMHFNELKGDIGYGSALIFVEKFNMVSSSIAIYPIFQST